MVVVNEDALSWLESGGRLEDGRFWEVSIGVEYGEKIRDGGRKKGGGELR